MVVTRSPRWLASHQMTLTSAQYSKAQRRFLTTFGGLGVAALAAGAFVLSYDDLRLLALRGGAVRRWAYLYPGMIDGLVVVVVLAILTARRAGWFSRAIRWLLLLVLIVGAGAAGVERTVKGYGALPHTWVKIGVAVAPWAILILAVWLWISMIKQARGARRRRLEPEPVPATVVDKSIIPGLADHSEEETLPLPRPVRELEPVRETVPPGPRPLGPPPPIFSDSPAFSAEPSAPPATPDPEPEPEPEPAPWTAPEPTAQDEDAEPADTTIDTAPDPDPDPDPEPSMNVNDDDDPTPRMVARTSLPTDVRLVGGPPPRTRPDGIRLADTQPDGIPIAIAVEDDHEGYTDERAEDPDAGDEDLGQWARAGDEEPPSGPPSGNFRSSPTPPRE